MIISFSDKQTKQKETITVSIPSKDFKKIKTVNDFIKWLQKHSRELHIKSANKSVVEETKGVLKLDKATIQRLLKNEPNYYEI